MDIANAVETTIQSIRGGMDLVFKGNTYSFNGTRYLQNNKRFGAGEMREIVEQYVEHLALSAEQPVEAEELDEVVAFEDLDEQLELAEAAARFDEQQINDAIDAHLNNTDAPIVTVIDEVHVRDAAAQLQLSEVRIRRLVTEGRLEYGSRGHITLSSLAAEIRRRETNDEADATDAE